MHSKRLFARFSRALLVGMFTCGLLATTSVMAQETAAEESKSDKPKSKFPAWDEVTKDHKKLEGFLDMYYNEKEQSLLLELKSSNLDKDLILPMAIARGAGSLILGGDTLNFGNQWVIQFRRAAGKILVVRRNVTVRANKGSPEADAVDVSYNDSVILALPIRSEKGGSVLVDAADIFMTDLANIGIRPDRQRSTWFKVKNFPENVVIQVSAVFSLSGGFFFFGGDDIPDMRGAQVVMHYGLSAMPNDSSFKPREADDRVGHFLSVVRDFSTATNRTPDVRYVTRWNLIKSDSSAEKSPPKEPIIFWIERTVPREYRPYVKAGILEWNKAFEKVGFVDAIQVRDQQPTDEFESEDIRYNTFRWIATSQPFAMGPSRTNPTTGQILDADILFDESFVRYWREDYLTTVGMPAGMKLLDERMSQQAWNKLHAADLPWVVLAQPQLDLIMKDPQAAEALAARNMLGIPAAQSVACGFCSPNERCMLGQGMNRQLNLMAAMMQAEGKLDSEGQVPLEYIGQAIKEVTMHEVGHTLGLRHNFKASTMLTLEECNNPEITRKKGMAGSVMDYLPANFAPEGKEQGDYFSQTIGPYDYWAIEYAYTPEGSEEALDKIASRVAEPDLTYATDEDAFSNPDPRINLYDLGDPLEYSQQRVELVEQRLKDLAERVVSEGDGWQRARVAFSTLMGELSSAAVLSAQYIGGEYTARDHRGDPDARDPYSPIPAEKQREAMAFLGEHILSDQAFSFSPALLRRLAPEHWRSNSFFMSSGSAGYPIYDVAARIQGAVLSRFLNGTVLSNIQNIELHADEDQDVLRMPEVFDMLSENVWSELPSEAPGEDETAEIAISTIRRNLQRDYVERLAAIVLRSSFQTADAQNLANMHLQMAADRIQMVLDSDQIEMDDYSKAHLMELNRMLEKVSEASLEMGRL